MAVSYMDFTSPHTQFTFDMNNNRFFTKNSHNYINALGISQLNTLGNVSLLDIRLSLGNVVEPHVHQNASELVYCISGAAVVSLINPFTKELLSFTIKPGQVANVPQGWFHWEVATENHTHLLAVFDAPVPEFIAVSDFLRLAPAGLLSHTYCLDEAKLREALAPISDTTVIGPPAHCGQQDQHAQHAQHAQQQQGHHQPYPQHPNAMRAPGPGGYAQIPPSYVHFAPQEPMPHANPVIGNGYLNPYHPYG
ncbi:Cupin [Paenibacillus sp. UNCCL117]|uniref:cupin domain-containing protein n=1 Tax=unclassified Paenibacillus TaxID=185978 RepID=UPI00087EF229|nr:MULTISPECIES: cupin domain-containing protein [unclassified Paenibacillus]SDD01900.1 Cupin [Paenibacillus sp. cl123]SFW32592.1 Cupin [Paenibacillus sp. UNCCL117]